MPTYQFLVTIDSERPLRPQDLMEAFESSQSIKLDEDFVVVTVAAPTATWRLRLLQNDALPAISDLRRDKAP